MKIFHFLFLAFLLVVPNYGTAQDTDPLTFFPGEWKIDLRPTPDAEGHYQAFAVTAIEGNTFTGSFYGSPIENGFINPNWDRFYFAFTTYDQSNAYYHSGYLSNSSLSGISYCPNRAFTAPWAGSKE